MGVNASTQSRAWCTRSVCFVCVVQALRVCVSSIRFWLLPFAGCGMRLDIVEDLGSRHRRSWRTSFPKRPHERPHWMPQLTTTEQNLIDKLVRKEKKKPIEAWRAVKKYRAKTKGKSKQEKRLGQNTVYEYCKGVTHQRGALETRGRLPTLRQADVRKLLANPSSSHQADPDFRRAELRLFPKASLAVWSS